MSTSTPSFIPRQSAMGSTQDRPYHAMPGILALGAMLVSFAAAVWIGYSSFGGVDPYTGRPLLFSVGLAQIIALPVLILLGLVLFSGLTTLEPRQAIVLTFFGNYYGTFAKPGFWWINPLTGGTRIPLSTTAEETKAITVNDLMGNPITIAAMVTWRVDEAARAHFDVTNYANFVTLQAEAALRHVASIHPYDRAEGKIAQADAAPDAAPITKVEATQTVALRSDREAINEELIQELGERTRVAGVIVEEVRITNLAYAPEIASAMLKRQQAQAILDSRRLMVEGAVGIVQDTLTQLAKPQDGKSEAIAFDPEQKAQFAANLLIVIAGDKEANPILNVGTMRP